MHLFPALRARYTREPFSAPEAQRRAELIAWSPVVFEVSRLMVKFGILSLLRDSDAGLTVEEIAEATSLSPYAVTVLTDASLSIGTILVDEATDRFSLSKTGWFLLTDEGTRVNLDFNHAVNYRGMFHLEEALREGCPAGLATLGDWPTIYEGLSQLPDDVRESWFAFDHYYSDHSFSAALDLVFSRPIHHLMDVGGNTGRFALRCVERDAGVCVTIVDLPGQIGLMRRNVAGQLGAERIEGVPADLLDPLCPLPTSHPWDVIWMSQFLDCFSEAEILTLLTRAADAMGPETSLFIMETFWDRQRYETASLCLTLTSVYFTAMANGNSKMYHSERLFALIERAGLEVVAVHDGLGRGHTLLEVRRTR